MRLLTAAIAIVAGLGAASARPAAIDFHALTPGADRPVGGPSAGDGQALQEMLGSSHAPQRWKQAPKLTVLESVMDYRPGGDVEYTATEERLSESEISELVDDLTDGLSMLTANTFEQFSSVAREVVPAGAAASVSRPDQIVIARFSGLRQSVKTLGFGGRRTRRDGTITAGAILLDSEFDRTSAKRRLLRTHELGHALGYNHVYSRTSIMNPQIGAEPNEFDRGAATIAFRAPSVVAARQVQ